MHCLKCYFFLIIISVLIVIIIIYRYYYRHYHDYHYHHRFHECCCHHLEYCYLKYRLEDNSSNKLVSTLPSESYYQSDPENDVILKN